MGPPPETAVQPGRRHAAFLIAAAASWGIGTVVSKQAVAEVPPLTLLVVQLAVSVAFLVLLAALRGERWPAGRDGRLLGRLGLLNPGLAYALSLIGLTEITASLSVLFWATEPILILALAALVLGERLGAGIVGATAIAVVGLGLVVFDPAASGSIAGAALTLAGVAVCAVYSVATRRWLPGASDSTLGVVLAQQVHALGLAIVVVAGLGLAGVAFLPERITLAGAASAAGSGLLYYAIAYLFYLSALRALPASVAAASFYLIPLFGVGAAWLVGERLEPLQWLGGALVVGAVAVITMRPSRFGRDVRGQAPSADASAQMARSPSDSSRA
jgi:drug/metabolite transporter (DMT)-like permease